MECPYCKYENRDGVRYCSNCGKALSPTTTATSTSTTVGGNSRSLTVGTPLQGGRYVIKQVLGEGGMGAALLATDKRLDNKSVVIKELVSDSTDPEKFKEDERNFKQEVVTLAHLDHPLIPNVTDNFEEGSRYFMVQEYIEGENLENRMDRLNQPMKEREVLGFASEVLDVLDYLSQQTPPIVHRDIKPANIIISSKDKRAHLVDFGIARADVARNVKRKQTSALGTPGYAPPEQYQGNADPRSDLYALGATMHHLLTNRDPRNYPPFAYPPARTLNPQLSPEIERVLTHALNNDITLRYQSAAAMKRDVDDILLKRFGVSGSISSYVLGTSGPIAAAGAASAAGTTMANASTLPNQPPRVQKAPVTPLPPPAPSWQAPSYQAGGMYAPPPRQRGGSTVARNFLLFLIAIILLGALAFAAFNFINNRGTASNSSTPTAVPVPSNGIGVTKAPDGGYIGVSDGTFAFDTNRADGNAKTQAADKLKSGDSGSAQSLWQSAVAQESNDAEALIYLEDQRVIASGSPWITIVVGTMLSGDAVGVGRDDLQGAYVAQKEYNDGSKLTGGVQVRLLVASSGNQSKYATTVAQQIVKLAQNDKTFVGVMGWPYSSRTLDSVNVLSAAHIPMVSQTASTDLLTGRSPYFFRVAPSNNRQGIIGAQYAESTLHAKSVALFVDPSDSYSQNLANDFKKQFVADGNSIVVTETYKVGVRDNLPTLLQDALTHNPDLIYFSGYASDVSTLLTDLPTSGQFAGLQVLGGDALYELGGYPSSARVGFSRLRFTAFAYPDMWDVLGYTAQKPAFFKEYPNAFNPNGEQHTNPYGFVRADNDVILSYDAMLALLNGSNIALAGGKQSITPDDLQKALAKINGPRSFQGVSGQISFGSNGDPVDKVILILYVDPNGFIKMEPSPHGTFLKS